MIGRMDQLSSFFFIVVSLIPLQPSATISIPHHHNLQQQVKLQQQMKLKQHLQHMEKQQFQERQTRENHAEGSNDIFGPIIAPLPLLHHQKFLLPYTPTHEDVARQENTERLRNERIYKNRDKLPLLINCNSFICKVLNLFKSFEDRKQRVANNYLKGEDDLGFRRQTQAELETLMKERKRIQQNNNFKDNNILSSNEGQTTKDEDDLEEQKRRFDFKVLAKALRFAKEMYDRNQSDRIPSGPYVYQPTSKSWQKIRF